MFNLKSQQRETSWERERPGAPLYQVFRNGAMHINQLREFNSSLWHVLREFLALNKNHYIRTLQNIP